ncbi:programmed cell death protein 2-like [Paramormyrops kingsleyae]|uniref:Programmed cell death 2-like n=1 Tax=Paramormyrops kingsleyae TaxID=1676925 RepID=A0A3B3QK11_9TELE|nr:programmed cell death protein 2-like [Paramormyrops kingsleyae]
MAAADSQVLIGLCDVPIGKSCTSTFFTNKIGDLPDLLPAFSLRYPYCAICGSALVHVVQVYCPLGASRYHRTINVFACPQQQCSGKTESWKVLRSQCLESEIKAKSDSQRMKVKEPPMATSDWCEGADDWGIEEEEGTSASPAHNHTNTQSSFLPKLDVSYGLQALSLTEAHQSASPRPELVFPESVPIFRPYYVCVLEEGDIDEQTDMEDAHRLLREYEMREGVAVMQLESFEGQGELERYEKTDAKHGDKVFSKFMKCISLCPKQILRYSWNGSPLFITDPSSSLTQTVPPCSYCGNPRVFEFQLMPALVSLLESINSTSELLLEFGTVLVYTCRDSCWQPGRDSPAEEFVLVQKDPDHQLFSRPC